jgi:hypothetical protein
MVRCRGRDILGVAVGLLSSDSGKAGPCPAGRTNPARSVVVTCGNQTDPLPNRFTVSRTSETGV